MVTVGQLVMLMWNTTEPDEYALRELRAGTKFKYPRLAIILALADLIYIYLKPLYDADACNGPDISYMDRGCLCLLALALRIRAPACMGLV